VAGEVVEKQFVDLRRHLVGCLMADARQGHEAAIHLDELGRPFGREAANRVISLALDEQGRHPGGADWRALATSAIPGERSFHGRRRAKRSRPHFPFSTSSLCPAPGDRAIPDDGASR